MNTQKKSGNRRSTDSYPHYRDSRIPVLNLENPEDLTYDATKIFISARKVFGSPVSVIGVDKQGLIYTSETSIAQVLFIDLKSQNC